MSPKDFEGLAALMHESLKRLASLRAAEAAISTDGSINSSSNCKVWIENMELKLTEPKNDDSRGLKTIRGMEMVALGLKKVLQGKIDHETARIDRLRQKIAEGGDL